MDQLKIWIPFDKFGNILWEDLERSTKDINSEWEISDTIDEFPIDCQQGTSIQSINSIAVISISRDQDESQTQAIKSAIIKKPDCIEITYTADGVKKKACYPRGCCP